MRGGRDRNRVLGRAPVGQVAAPDERVEGVVVQERVAEPGEDQGADESRGQPVDERPAPPEHWRGSYPAARLRRRLRKFATTPNPRSRPLGWLLRALAVPSPPP